MVQGAKNDLDACLVSPMWGYIDPKALGRQHKRFMSVMGVVAQGASMGKTTGLTAALFIFVLAVFLYNEEISWYGDLDIRDHYVRNARVFHTDSHPVPGRRSPGPRSTSTGTTPTPTR